MLDKIHILLSYWPSSAAQEDEVVDKESEKERRRREYVRTYVSPWERAMRGNQELTATMRTSMPGPGRVQFPQYKSFNRYTLKSHFFVIVYIGTDLYALLGQPIIIIILFFLFFNSGGFSGMRKHTCNEVSH